MRTFPLRQQTRRLTSSSPDMKANMVTGEINTNHSHVVRPQKNQSEFARRAPIMSARCGRFGFLRCGDARGQMCPSFHFLHTAKISTTCPPELYTNETQHHPSILYALRPALHEGSCSLGARNRKHSLGEQFHMKGRHCEDQESWPLDSSVPYRKCWWS